MRAYQRVCRKRRRAHNNAHISTRTGSPSGRMAYEPPLLYTYTATPACLFLPHTMCRLLLLPPLPRVLVLFAVSSAHMRAPLLPGLPNNALLRALAFADAVRGLRATFHAAPAGQQQVLPRLKRNTCTLPACLPWFCCRAARLPACHLPPRALTIPAPIPYLG